MHAVILESDRKLIIASFHMTLFNTIVSAAKCNYFITNFPSLRQMFIYKESIRYIAYEKIFALLFKTFMLWKF